MAHFDIQNLTFAYPDEKDVLKGVNLSVARGEFIALCGKSGSGKTTLLRHLKTVLTPHGRRSGSVLFDETPLEQVSLRDQSAKIGYVMQNPDSQIVTDKVWHELAFGLESLGYDQATMRLRVAEMASYFGIQDWFHRNVAELSGGQKQLLNLASIMAMQPEVLILDEPTSQLDPIAASDFLNTVRKINRELGTTVIITEHRLEDIFHAADRVIVMDEGTIIASDAPKRVGEMLKNRNDDMFAAMPAPVRVFYGVNASGDCPLTVRDGRNWLNREMQGIAPAALPPEKPIDEDAEPALKVKEIWFRYEKDAPDVLRGVTFEAPKGSLFAIVGGNGTGKSTLLKSICGICPPYRGKIEVNGRKIRDFKRGELFRGNLSMLPQDPQSLFVKKTVREDLREMLSMNDEGADAKISEVSEKCEISHLLERHPYDLSGGEQQRAALAKVLLTNPKTLLLDEPTKGIDAFFKEKLARVLQKLISSGVTVIMVSHDVEFCARYADYVSMFFDGQILTTNTPRKFFARNSFYTTAANRMSRHIFPDAVTAEDVIELYLRSKGGNRA